MRLVKGMNLGALRPLTPKSLGPDWDGSEPLFLADEGTTLGEGEDCRVYPLFTEAMDESVKGEAEAKIFASWEDRIAPSLDALQNQNLRCKALEILRRHQAMWSGHLGEVTATEHRID